MIVSELEKAVTSVKEEGKCPLAVIATAGTTVLGAFDPLTEIASVCQKHKLWMHIDVSILKILYLTTKNFYLSNRLV